MRSAGVVDLYARHVIGALQAATPAERECIELTYFEGLTVDEIAARRATSPMTVSNDVRRGLDGMLTYLRACAEREAQTGSLPR